MADHRTTSSAQVARDRCIPILLVALLGGGLPSAAGAATLTETKDLLKCGKKLIKNAAAFMKSERKQVGKCSLKLLACDLKLANGEISSEKFTKCEDKAKEKCASAKQKELDLEVIRSDKILLACAGPTVAYEDVTDLPEGLGYGIGPCGSEPNLPAFVGCLKGPETLELALNDVTLALPRSRELLESAGVAGDFPDLPPPLCGNGVPNDGEECDDGNFDDGDGCTKGCLTEPVAFIRTLDRLLAYLRLEPIRVAHAQVPSKPLLKCGKRIESGVRKFLDFEIKKVSACALSYLTCDLKFLNGDIDADKYLSCKSRADAKCDKTLIKESQKKAKASARILDRCSSVAFEDIMDVSGLGYGVGSCSQEPNLPGLVDCMVASTEAQDQALVAVSLLMPRARELLEARALETGQPAPFALPDPRCGNGTLDTNEACDDGNTVPGDGCDRDCTLTSCGNGVLDPSEQCDAPDDGACPGECRADCSCAGGVPPEIGNHKCVLDPNSSSLETTTASGGVVTSPLVGSLDISCGAVDPNTGKPVCGCDLQQDLSLPIPGLGQLCITATTDPNSPCLAGEIDCDGGSGLDLDRSSDHNVGSCVDNVECRIQCRDHCSLEGKKVFDHACEGFCVGGSNNGGACLENGDCPGGDCPGQPAHGHICGCHCISRGGNPSSAGGLQCNLGMNLVVETAAPCDGTDVITTLRPQCLPLSTELSALQQFNPDLDPNGFAVLTQFGAPADCLQLTGSTTSGIGLVGSISFFDATLTGSEDLTISLRFNCQ